MPLPPPSLTAVRADEKCGRALFATEAIAAGAPILCEAALASVVLDGAAGNPWAVAAELAIAVASAGQADATRELHPREPAQYIVPADETAEHEAAVEAVCARGGCGAGRIQELVTPEEARRLLHVVVRNALALCGRQCLFLGASMANHSCSPNATQLGFFEAREGGHLCVCFRAVRDIAAGEAVTISYVADLATSVQERRQALAHHGIEPSARPCDAALTRWRLPTEDAKRAQTESSIGACNVAADGAWEAAAALQRAGDGAAARPKLMEAAQQYAKLLQLADGALDNGHEVLLQARERLAKVMGFSGAQRSRANALPLWRAVLAAVRPCVPPSWPQLLEPLRGVIDAAEAAGEAADEERAELQRVLAVLNPSCSDLA